MSLSFSSGCIAKYMNCVISDMIHSAMNPTILCFVVCHYVSDTEVSQHMATVRSAHKALLHYLSYWMPSFTQLQDKIDYLKVLLIWLPLHCVLCYWMRCHWKKTETVIRKQSIFIKIKEVTLTSNIVAIGRKHLALTEIGRSKGGKSSGLCMVWNLPSFKHKADYYARTWPWELKILVFSFYEKKLHFSCKGCIVFHLFYS